jgi:hypothetical protein
MSYRSQASGPALHGIISLSSHLTAVGTPQELEPGEIGARRRRLQEGLDRILDACRQAGIPVREGQG